MRGRKKGFTPYNKHIWTEEELSIIKDNFHILTNQQIADKLGMKLTSVRTKCHELGLKRMEMEYWTDEQVEFLKSNYQTAGDVELAEYFNSVWEKQKGWTKKHIEKKRRYLNLKRNEDEKVNIHTRNKLAGRFKDCSRKMWLHRGVKPNGTVVTWNHSEGKRKFIKIKGIYVLYAPWLYEQLYGAFPEGMVVRVRDGNSLNIVPGNLELIDRAENARRNSYFQYPLELKQVIRLRNQLKNKLKQYEQSN